jgi:hypothetical protein
MQPVPSVPSVPLSGSNWNYSRVELIFLHGGYPQSTDAIPGGHTVNRTSTIQAMNCYILSNKCILSM